MTNRQKSRRDELFKYTNKREETQLMVNSNFSTIQYRSLLKYKTVTDYFSRQTI